MMYTPVVLCIENIDKKFKRTAFIYHLYFYDIKNVFTVTLDQLNAPLLN